MAHFKLDIHRKCQKSLCHKPVFAQKTLQGSHRNDLINSFLMLHYLETKYNWETEIQYLKKVNHNSVTEVFWVPCPKQRNWQMLRKPFSVFKAAGIFLTHGNFHQLWVSMQSKLTIVFETMGLYQVYRYT